MKRFVEYMRHPDVVTLRRKVVDTVLNHDAVSPVLTREDAADLRAWAHDTSARITFDLPAPEDGQIIVDVRFSVDRHGNVATVRHEIDAVLDGLFYAAEFREHAKVMTALADLADDLGKLEFVTIKEDAK